jgi:molybdopterin/thiamine biosynthesis adenylyltransferase
MPQTGETRVKPRLTGKGEGMNDDERFSRERKAGYEPDCMAQGVALVAGVGAVGQNIVQNLALSGLGEIRIMDKDIFEDHNRTRSPAYPSLEEQRCWGMGKARAVAYKLRPLMTAPNPTMRYAARWIQELGDGAFEGVSVILACVDTPRARAYLADKACLHRIPLIEAGFEGADLSLSCYAPAHGAAACNAPCWRCAHQELAGAFSCRFYAAQAEAMGVIPAIQNGAATLAGLQAEAAILAIHGQMPLASRRLDLNLRTGKTHLTQLASDPQCPGLHRILDSSPIDLATSADACVAELLREIGDHMGGCPILQLPQPFVWAAPCTRCGTMVAVQQADWQWMMTPYCTAHGGPFLPAEDGLARAPSVYVRIFAESRPELLEMSCWVIGLPPRALVEAFVSDGLPQVFRLAGSLDDLFEIVPAAAAG